MPGCEYETNRRITSNGGGFCEIVHLAFRLLGYKIRVLGTHRPLRGSPLPAWAYRAEASNDDDALQQPVWSCPHAHETPQLAQSCGQEWLLMNQTQEQAAS